ncbi:hypothetical protein H1C71_035074 [Ictidomys tridecemlineatus]|nr:hypothetical protein H1C71_035074 [Ictidomys tridecemlineatus]
MAGPWGLPRAWDQRVPYAGPCTSLHVDTFLSLGNTPSRRIPGSKENLMFSSLRKCQTVFQNGPSTSHIPATNVQGLQFLHIFATLAVACLLNFSS